MKILLTGVAGFIGAHIAQSLNKHKSNLKVVGIDNLNTYYDLNLKKSRLKWLCASNKFQFYKLDIIDRDAIDNLFQNYNFDIVIHMAAQAGVRYSLENPKVYIDSNIVGFANILEACRRNHIKHFLFASSSSVYGANKSFPFQEKEITAHPVSLYAATKKSNELMAHSYASLYNLPCTGLRFFTIYGPWGRPDMAPFKFVRNILTEQSIDVYNYGNMLRSFTYIDDAVDAVKKLIKSPPSNNNRWYIKMPDPSISYAPYRIFNVGNDRTIKLIKFIETIEKITQKKAKINFLPLQAGDMIKTCADVSNLKKIVGVKFDTKIEEGLNRFIDWFVNYYNF